MHFRKYSSYSVVFIMFQRNERETQTDATLFSISARKCPFTDNKLTPKDFAVSIDTSAQCIAYFKKIK